MDHLIMREISLGGYCLGFTLFHRLDLASRSSSLSSSSSSIVDDAISGVPALVFSATTENEYYLGPEKMLSMAKTIANAEGPSGHNIEYLVKICDFMRELPPDIDDNHLLRLEKLTLQYMAERGEEHGFCHCDNLLTNQRAQPKFKASNSILFSDY